MIKKLLLLFLLTVAPVLTLATTTQLTGTLIDSTGNPLSGTACFKLPVNAVDTSTSRALSPSQICFSLTNGIFPPFASLVPNDVIQPLGTYYQARFSDRTGALIFMANYVIPTGGGTFNIGAAIPTQILTTNISYATPVLTTGNNSVANINKFYFVDGVTYTTPQAAMTAANASGGGTVWVPCSTFVGPTTWYSNVSVKSMCSPESTNIVGSQGIPNNTTAQTIFTYTSSLTWTLLQNIVVEGITFDFGNNGAGLILNSSSFNNTHYLSVIRCGSPTVDCIQLKSNGAGGTNNTIKNQFEHTRILGNQSTNARNGIQINSTTSASVTLNTFTDTFIGGNWQGCIDSELNSDTNYFYGVLCNPLGVVANSYVLGYNLLTPGSDQDADGGLYDGLIYSGASVTSIVRAGQSNGNVIRATIPGGVLSKVITGGNPTWSYSLMGLPGATQDSVWAGRLAASAVPGDGPATGSVAGDISAAESATAGAVLLGSDGNGKLSRSGNTASFTYGTNAAIFPAAGGTTYTVPGGVFNAAGTGQTGNPHIVEDSSTLVSGTPSVATITLAGQAIFSTSASYNCAVTNKTTQANSLKIAYTDGSHFVVTGPNTVTDAFSFICVGN